MADNAVIIENVCQACLQAAMAARESAGIRGLCADRRWEPAVRAVRTLDLDKILEKHRT